MTGSLFPKLGHIEHARGLDPSDWSGSLLRGAGPPLEATVQQAQEPSGMASCHPRRALQKRIAVLAPTRRRRGSRWVSIVFIKIREEIRWIEVYLAERESGVDVK